MEPTGYQPDMTSIFKYAIFSAVVGIFTVTSVIHIRSTRARGNNDIISTDLSSDFYTKPCVKGSAEEFIMLSKANIDYCHSERFPSGKSRFCLLANNRKMSESCFVVGFSTSRVNNPELVVFISC